MILKKERKRGVRILIPARCARIAWLADAGPKRDHGRSASAAAGAAMVAEVPCNLTPSTPLVR
jgi:hypothetical protein